MAVEMFKQGLELFADQWQSPGSISFYASADLDDYITISTTSNRPLITGVGNYLVLGVDGTAGSATSADDVLVGGKLEVDGATYLDSTLTLAGAIAGGDQAWTGVGDMTFTAGSIITAIDGAGTTLLFKSGGLTGTTFITLTSQSGGTDTMILGKSFYFDAGGEYIVSDGSTLTIAGAVSFTGSTIVTADSATIEIGAAGVIKSGATDTDTLLIAANDTTFITLTTAATDVCTIANATMSGTWLASGTVTIPAITLGGNVTTNGRTFEAGAGSIGINSTAASLLFLTTTSDGTYGPYLQMVHESANPANDDIIGAIQVTGRDSAGAQNISSSMNFVAENVTDGAEATKIEWYNRVVAASNLAMSLSSIGVLAPDHSIMFGQSQDSVLAADQVSLGGYEIGAANRVLAISQETAVAVDVDETKFSHKMQVRINGATYFMMLTAT